MTFVLNVAGGALRSGSSGSIAIYSERKTNFGAGPSQASRGRTCVRCFELDPASNRSNVQALAAVLGEWRQQGRPLSRRPPKAEGLGRQWRRAGRPQRQLLLISH